METQPESQASGWFNAKDAKQFAKERKEGFSFATFAKDFATFAVKPIDSLSLNLVFTVSVATESANRRQDTGARLEVKCFLD